MWSSRWTTNWRANDYKQSLRWWHRPVGHFGGRTTRLGGSPTASQPQIGPTAYSSTSTRPRQWRTTTYTHSEWTTGTGGCIPVPDYRRWWVYDGIPYQVKQRAGDRGITEENIQKSQRIPISTKIRLMKALVWPVAMYGCESWTLRKNEEARLEAFELNGLRKILRVSWTTKKTNEWVFNKAGVKMELLDTVKARKWAHSR